MFSWKRPRKEEEQPGRCPVDAAASPPGAPSSDPADDALQPPTPAAVGDAVAGGGSSDGCSSTLAQVAAGPGCSIELAPLGGGGGLPAPLPVERLERCSVRTKAAYFEALIHSNTTAHIVCSAEGGQHCSYPSSSGDGGDAHMLFADVSSRGGDDAAGVAAGAAAGAGGGYSEVHMVLRMPHPVAPAQPQQPACGRYGSVAEMEALIEHLQGALALKEQQRQAAADAYARRTAECDNLTRVVRELSQGRARAAAGRARLAEQYVELQGEYHRMLRIADLSRTVSKENLAHTSRTRSELRAVQSELHATRSHASSLSDRCLKLRGEKAALREKVTLLERLDFEEAQESASKRVFTRRIAETY